MAVTEAAFGRQMNAVVCGRVRKRELDDALDVTARLCGLEMRKGKQRADALRVSRATGVIPGGKLIPGRGFSGVAGHVRGLTAGVYAGRSTVLGTGGVCTDVNKVDVQARKTEGQNAVFKVQHKSSSVEDVCRQSI